MDLLYWKITSILQQTGGIVVHSLFQSRFEGYHLVWHTFHFESHNLVFCILQQWIELEIPNKGQNLAKHPSLFQLPFVQFHRAEAEPRAAVNITMG
jgi:hypothetical protein